MCALSTNVMKLSGVDLIYHPSWFPEVPTLAALLATFMSALQHWSPCVLIPGYRPEVTQSEDGCHFRKCEPKSNMIVLVIRYY